ncbi:MAG: beta-galactosidase [Candidatus Pacebacteria bacterium]|nr:beta-galactosidase [Candidatus Paceibacterota bacterium]
MIKVSRRWNILSPFISVIVAVTLHSRHVDADTEHLLGWYDFAAGNGENLTVTVTPEGEFTVGDCDGYRLLRITPSTSAPVEIRDGQHKPEFPNINLEEAGKKQDVRINLSLSGKDSLGIDPGKPENVMVVLELYDVGYTGTFGSYHFHIYGSGKERRDAIAHGTASGSNWGNMPMTRARIRKRPYLLQNTLLNGSVKDAPGSDISIRVNSSLLVRSIFLYRVNMADYDLFETRLRDLNEQQIPLLRKRALVEDRAEQTRRMVHYLSLSGKSTRKLRKNIAAMSESRSSILRAIQEMETATDAFYFQGRTAVAEGDRDALDNMVAGIVDRAKAIDRELSELDTVAERTAAGAMHTAEKQDQYWWFSPLRTSPPPMPYIGGKINPRERIIFCRGDGGYSYRHDWKMPYARSVGVTFHPLAYMYPALQEDLASFAAHRTDDTRQAAFTQVFMNDMGSSVWSYRHTHILPLGSWFKKKYEGKTDIWTWTSAGEQKGRLNVFNDEVRQLFVDHHRAIARRQRFTRKWNLPWMGAEMMQFYGGRENGYSPSAVKKFRAYLKELYGDIDAMNAALGTEYADFATVEPPPDMGEVLRRRPGPLDYHFERFRRKGPVDIFDMSARAMKKENPDFQSWFESMARFDLTPAHGLDTYNMFRVADMAATHSQGEFNPIWNMSVHRYFPNTVYGKQEHLPQENEANCDPNVEMLRAAAHAGWNLELICRNRTLGLWGAPAGYRRALEPYGPYLHDGRRDVVPYRNSGESTVFRKRADAWLPLLNNLRWKHPEVGMLYSTTTQIVGWPYQETEFEGLNLHQWFFYGSIPYFVVHEDAVADTRETLGDYRVIIAPYAPLTQREISRKWLNWIRVGGVLLASGPFGVYDQFGQEDLTVLRTAFGDSLKIEYATDEIAGRGKNRLDAASIQYLRENGIFDVDSISGWFWNVEYETMPETARVLLRLEDGRPVLLEADYEGGRVVFSACGAFANQLGTLYMNQLRGRMTPFAQPTRQYGLLGFPLTDAAHRLYLMVINYDLFREVRDEITVNAALRRVVDVSLEHGFPVPFETSATTSTIDLELPPGRGALLDLGHEADMTWRVGQINEDNGTVPDPPPDIYSAKLKKLAASDRPPELTREAWALTALARRWASRGVVTRAREYLEKADALTKPPEFVSFDGDRVRAQRTKQPITIDGSLDDWSDAETYALKGSATSGGRFRVAYDNTYLYLAIAVRDDHVKNLGEEASGVNWVYACDGAEIALNPCDTTGKVPSGIVDNWLHDGFAALTFSVSGRMRAMPFTVAGPGDAKTATQRLEGGYAMEITFPLEDYCILPAAGASIGFDVKLKGATGTFSRYARRQGREKDGKRLGRLYFTQ